MIQTTLFITTILLCCFLPANAQQKSDAAELLQLQEQKIQKIVGQSWFFQGSFLQPGYKITRVEQSFWLENNWMMNELTEAEYDQFGGYEIVQSEVHDGQISPRARIFFEHSEFEDVMTEELYDQNSESFVPDFRTTWTYEGEDRLPALILFEEWEGDDWVLSERETTTFLEGGGVDILVELWDGEGWYQDSRIIILEENSDVVETYMIWNLQEDDWENDTRIIYDDLDLSGLWELSRQFSDLEGLRMIDALFIIMEIFPSHTSQQWLDDEWVNDHRFRRETENRLTDRIRQRSGNSLVILYIEEWEDEEWVAEFRNLFFYEDDILNEIEYQEIDNGDWMTIMVESYSRNDEGLLTSAVTVLTFDEMQENFRRVDFTWQGSPTDAGGDLQLPVTHRLGAAYPNPFNPTAVVPVEMAADGQVSITLYDGAGRLVATLFEGIKPAGIHYVQLNAAGLASGVYIIRMETAGFSATQAVTFIK